MDALRDSFFRTPTWRWEHALALAEAGERPSARDDAVTRRAVRFIRSIRTPRRPAPGSEFDVIRRAEELYTAGGLVRAELEARVLARQADAEVAARLAVPAEVVTAYTSLFFDVRDRIVHRDWVVVRVLGPGGANGFGEDTASLWRAYGFHGGQYVLDVVIAATVPGRWPSGGDWDLADPAAVARMIERARDAVAVARLPADTPLDKLVLVLEELRAGPRRGPARPTNRSSMRKSRHACERRDHARPSETLADAVSGGPIDLLCNAT